MIAVKETLAERVDLLVHAIVKAAHIHSFTNYEVLLIFLKFTGKKKMITTFILNTQIY